MWHRLSDVADHRRLDRGEFLKFALANADKFSVLDEEPEPSVSTWYVDGLVAAFLLDNQQISEEQAQASRLIRTMDVPDRRRDLSDPANVRWLLRNLGVRNSEDRMYPCAIRLLKHLAGESKDG